jgi:DNA primase
VRFSPEFVDKVRDSVNIADVIGQYTTFKHTGHNLMGLCPFPDHREKTGSFSVSEPKQVYYCFGCKKSGNIINFLMDYNGMSFVDSIEYLAQRASIPLPEDTYRGNDSTSTDKHKLLKINLLAGAFFKNSLADLAPTHPAREYLQKRGLSQEIIETFKIGFSRDEWSSLSQYLSSKKTPMNLAQNLGLIKQKPFKKESYDIFRNRIMFPILSTKGEVLGFGGRTIANENPKYLNSPESQVFHKGKVLYGLNESAKHIRIEDGVIVVEGYMDLIALYQFGFKNVVASMGTALTHDHAKALKRFTKNIYILFDSDQAGQFAQERSLPILLAEGLLPKAIDLADKKDPDDFLRSLGAEEFSKKIKSAKDLFFVIWERIFKGFNHSPTEKVQKVEAIAPYILSVQDLALRDLYIQEVAMQLSVEREWVLKTLRQQKVETIHKAPLTNKSENPNSISAGEEVFTKIKIKSPFKEEIFLVNLALSREEFMQELIDWGLQDKLTPSGLDLVFKKASDEYRQKRSNFATLTSNLCSVVEDPSIITLHLDQDWEANLDVQKLKDDCLQRVTEKSLKNQTKTLVNEIKADADPAKLEQFMNVIRNRQSLRQVKE